MAQQHCVLYALADDFDVHVSDMRGLGDAPLEIVRTPMAAALISRHDANDIDTLFKAAPEPHMHRLAQTFYTCVNTLSAAADILPVRFGTVLPCQSTVAKLIDRNAYSIHEGLEQIAGQQEWSLKLHDTTGQMQPPAPTPERDFLRAKLSARNSQAIHQERLGSLDEDLIATRTIDKGLRAGLQPFSAQDAGCFLNVRLLALRGRGQSVYAAVEAAVADVPDIDAEIVGPEAPYYFGHVDMQRDAA